jgi:hypothetical protein
VSREVTFDTICIVLEEYQEQRIEDIADQMMTALALLGDDLLDHLDPPVGLRRWLESHGLALIATRSPTPPAVWNAIEGADEEEEDIEEGDSGGAVPLLNVGEYVEYRTAPSGPHNQSFIGSGRINAITQDGWVIVQHGPHDEHWVNLQTDIIRPVGAP